MPQLTRFAILSFVAMNCTRSFVRSLFFVSAVSFFSCASIRTAGTDDGKIDVNLIQINDVYEIAPLNNGREGGMARVATIKKRELRENPNSFLIIAGDFLSPSVYNSLQYNGKPIRGKQMVETMNAAGMDYAIFGNHEFDIREAELQERLDESEFLWLSSNAFHKQNGIVRAFVQEGYGPLPEAFILDVEDADGTKAKIGFFGIVLPFNKADYVSYTDPLATAKEMYNLLKDSVDAVVAITHQAIIDDEKLAKELPGLAIIVGGHEHDQRFKKVGDVYITKALANARSAFIIHLHINKKKNKTTVNPELVMVDESIPFDSATQAVVQKWTKIAEANYASLGFDANRVLLRNGDPLDGRETEVRTMSTGLTRLIVNALSAAAPKADVVLLNGGSIRVDDVLHAPITEYDILRTLPFGGSIRQADVKGDLVIKALNAGLKNYGTGGFLHYNKEVSRDAAGNWLLKGEPIDPEKVYRVAMSDFLFTGREANLDFLQPRSPGVVKVYDEEKTSPVLADIRMAVVKYMDAKQMSN